MNKAGLQMPEGVEIDEATYTNEYGKFIIQPLERGFGVTLGNTLRRVLLSSIQGSAISSIRVDGVLHEFSTIEGVTEDLTEIILNLKRVRVKLLDKKPERVVLHLKGPGEFIAGYLQKNNADIEILNPNFHIATLNEDTDFSLEVEIRKGRGYVPAEENKRPDQPIGTIPIDAIFNPILNVSYTVENTRVGKRTDYEKLIMEVKTDGNITPEDAMTFAARILRDHVQLFISFDVKLEDEEGVDADEENIRIRRLLKKNVEDLELSVRSANCLKEAKIKTIGDLVRKSEGEMLKFRNFGRKSLQELSEILRERALEFGMDVDKYLKDFGKKRPAEPKAKKS